MSSRRGTNHSARGQKLIGGDVELFAIRDDVEAMRYDGCVLLVARRGRVAFHEAFGFADRSTGRMAGVDDVFFSMSIAKQLTNTMVMMRVERGEVGLHTRVAEVIPAFAWCRAVSTDSL